MVEFANDLVVNVDGAIYKCPAFVGREGFAVGDLRSGIIDDGAAYNPDVWKKPECLECAYLPQCFGGCRFLKFVRDGNIDRRGLLETFPRRHPGRVHPPGPGSIREGEAG